MAKSFDQLSGKVNGLSDAAEPFAGSWLKAGAEPESSWGSFQASTLIEVKTRVHRKVIERLHSQQAQTSSAAAVR